MRLTKGNNRRARRQQIESGVAILDVGEVNDGAREKARRVDQDVPLATLGLLARVVACRIKRSPPFGAPFAVLGIDDGGAVELLRDLPVHAPPRRARDRYARTCRPSSTKSQNSRAPCSSAGGPWAAPSTGSRSTARQIPFKTSRTFTERLRPPCRAGGMIGSAESPLGVRQVARITRPLRFAARRCSAVHMGRSLANASAQTTRSHPIYRTQQLLGSALTAASKYLLKRFL